MRTKRISALTVLASLVDLEKRDAGSYLNCCTQKMCLQMPSMFVLTKKIPSFSSAQNIHNQTRFALRVLINVSDCFSFNVC